METKIFNSTAELDRAAASEFVKQVTLKPSSVIGLSTGRTTGPIHQTITTMYEQCPFDTSSLVLFALDEIAGVPKEYSGACYTMIRNEIADSLHIPDERLITLPVKSEHWEKDFDSFVESIASHGGIDLLFLGLGTNCHLGFNQPGTEFSKMTAYSWMMPELEERIREETGITDDTSLGGVTLGIRGIMNSRRIILAAKGAEKAEAVKKMIQGPVCEEVPASVLQLHPFCTILLDKEAASLL